MWTRSAALATVATVAVGLSVVASPPAARAAAPQSRTAAAVSPLAVAGAGHFVDLGLLTANNAPVGITDDDQVALRSGWWRNGVLTPPPTPAGAVGPMSIEAMTGTGLIVGTADFNSGANNLRVVGWRPSASVTPSVFPPQCESGGMPFFAEGSYAASSDDEVAVGASGFCYDHPDYAMSTTFGTSTYAQIPGLGFPYSLRKDWALGYRPGNTAADPALRLNRRTGVTTPLPVTVGLNEQDLAPDGTVIGSDVVTHVGETIAANGTVTPLPLLPGYATVAPLAIADNNLIVGLAADSSSNPTKMRAVMWPTPTSTPVDLTSRFPAGWVPGAAHVNIHGHMTGLAKDTNGAYHAFFSDGPASDAALRISSVTINPVLPKVADRTITGTATVVNDGTTDTVTGVVVGVSNTTPTVVSVSGRPTPGSIGSLAAGASARVTFRLTPRKSGEASLTITARGQNGDSLVTATPRVRRFTIGSVITLSLARVSGPDAKGRTTVRATVRNLVRSLSAASCCGSATSPVRASRPASEDPARRRWCWHGASRRASSRWSHSRWSAPTTCGEPRPVGLRAPRRRPRRR